MGEGEEYLGGESGNISGGEWGQDRQGRGQVDRIIFNIKGKLKTFNLLTTSKI